MKEKSTSKARRKFLFALGLTGAGAASVAVMKAASQAGEATQLASTESAQGRGYQESEHVRRYYQTTRV
jgi:hypothetical protein